MESIGTLSHVKCRSLKKWLLSLYILLYFGESTFFSGFLL